MYPLTLPSRSSGAHIAEWICIMITLSAPPKRSSIAVSLIRTACFSSIAAPVIRVLISIGSSGMPSRLRMAIGSIDFDSGS